MEKRMYHVAHVNLKGEKTWTKARSLSDAKEFAEELAATTPLKGQAKSHYEWITENGVTFGVEREEHANNPKLVSISVFERDDPALDPKPSLTPEQPLHVRLVELESFVAKVRDALALDTTLKHYKSYHLLRELMEEASTLVPRE